MILSGEMIRDRSGDDIVIDTLDTWLLSGSIKAV